MNSKHGSLNISFTFTIFILLIYFFYLNFSHLTLIDGFKKRKVNLKKTVSKTATNTTKTAANSASKLSGPIKKAVSSVKKELMSEIKKLENRMQGSVKKSIQKTTKPIKSSIGVIKNKMETITNTLGKMLKSIVTPIIQVFKHVGLMFSQLGLLVFDFLLQISQIPTCLISYITWILITLKDQVIITIVLPIIQKILKKIFGRFYPTTIVSYFIKFLNWLVNFHFYILSLFGSLLGINEIFYKDKCFSFTGNFKKRIDNIKKNLVNAANSFTQFGKF